MEVKFITNSKLRISHNVSPYSLSYVNTITCLLKYFLGDYHVQDTGLGQNRIMSHPSFPSKKLLCVSVFAVKEIIAA